MTAILNCDGGIDKDRMVFGYKIVVDNETLDTGCGKGGEGTSNQAEYLALEKGIKRCVSLGIKNLDIKMDSQLVVNQILGKYRVKSENLKTRHVRIMKLLEQFESWSISWVSRKKNYAADSLANKAKSGYRR